jgi:hypothetical protein
MPMLGWGTDGRGVDLQSDTDQDYSWTLRLSAKRNLKVEQRKICGAKGSIWKFAETNADDARMWTKVKAGSPHHRFLIAMHSLF